MNARWRHPLHAQPFDEPIASGLAEEYAELPWYRRMQAMRKALFREARLLATGQARRRADRVPAGARSMLWVYTWTTVGDAVMDLAPRVLLPQRLALDLLVAPSLAPLFASDRRVRRVYTDPSTLPADVDFVLLDSLRSPSLRLKQRVFSGVPFATMRGHNIGERFDRTAFADRRIRQLVVLPIDEVVQPALDLGDDGGSVYDADRTRIAVALGARLSRKRYQRWNELLRDVVAGWPRNTPEPEFRLLGKGSLARRDLKGIDADFVARHCVSLLDSGDLRKVALDIAECDAFLGVDGGLMHLSIAVGTPGVAMFSRVDPAYFLRPDSPMRPIRYEGDVSELEPGRVAAEFLSALPAFVGVASQAARA